MGGTGLEPVTPSLSIRGRRSRPCAPVRLTRIIPRNLQVLFGRGERDRTFSVATVATLPPIDIQSSSPAKELVEIDRRIAAGATQEEVAEGVGCDPRTVIRWITRTGGVRRYERRRSTRFLSLAEREEIALGVSRGETAVTIARRIGRATSTVTREVARNGGRRGYRAARADLRALGWPVGRSRRSLSGARGCERRLSGD